MERRRSHLSQPSQLNTHEHSLGIIKEASSTVPGISHYVWQSSAEKCQLTDSKCPFFVIELAHLHGCSQNRLS